MIHFDHAATGLPRLPAAVQAVHDAAELPSAGRGRHRGQARTAQRLADARAALAELTGGTMTVFTAGATHALNQAIGGLEKLTRAALDPLAHDAARLPLEKRAAPIWTMPHAADGRIDLARTAAEWPRDLDTVVVGHGSNVNGVLQPVAELTELAHARGARIIVDAAQTAGVLPLGQDAAKADMVCFSSHKGLRALPGSGALVCRGTPTLAPLIVGGTGSSAETTSLPEALEAGTLNYPGAIAMGVAAASFRPWPYRERAAALREAVRRAGITTIWSGDLPTVSFVIPGHTPAFIEDVLDRAFDIAVRSGRHCAKLAHTTLGTLEAGTVRVSAGATTTDAELDMLTRALTAISSGRP